MQGKIINDPVYGFIRFPEKEMMKLIEHPWFQRLRNIKQMGNASFVYPGAVHTRFHHSLGAAHLMNIALNELKIKGIEITPEERLAARQAILLHDIGHGPFSHALEFSLIPDIRHEEISLLIMEQLNLQLDGQLETAINVFKNKYKKTFLHQLVSSQLDMDRMDYLNRDSFYTGVSEGVIGYHRILQMLSVKDDQLVVEEKGIHSIEKFIIARRLMYWQVYLHKTVISSEQMFIQILKRAKQLAHQKINLFAAPELAFFLNEDIKAADLKSDEKVLEKYCNLIDDDIFSAIKVWTNHSDSILSQLAKMLIYRHLYKVKLSNDSLEEEMKIMAKKATNIYDAESFPFFLFLGKASNNTYNRNDEQINILMKSGEIINVSDIEHSLINSFNSGPIEKNFICYSPELLNV